MSDLGHGLALMASKDTFGFDVWRDYLYVGGR